MLGLTVLGGVDTYLHNIIIERIIPDSPADKDGRLRPGDRILEVSLVKLHNWAMIVPSLDQSALNSVV